MRRRSHHRFIRPLATLSAVAALLLTAACADAGRFITPGSSGQSSVPLEPLKLEVAGPGDGATNVPITTEFPIATSGTVTSARLTAPGGASIEGSFPYGDGTWVPGSQLSYRTTYQLQVTAKRGRMEQTHTIDFTTGGAPGRTVGSGMYVSDDQTVGVGMPIIVELGASVPPARRAAVERRLFVSADPPVEGSWHWFSGTSVNFRPKDYWQPGTKVSVRLAIGGLELGNKRFGRSDRSATFAIGPKVVTKIDDASHTATVYKDDQMVKQLPTSLGKAGTPTSSGTHVVMEKYAEKVFDSESFGLSHENGGYKLKVYWDVRFTWGGEFVHAAPWSVADQGKRNVSHGCVNLSVENAKWFYEFSTKGDLIEIAGTGRTVTPGNGWTDWNLSWDEYQAGSALR
ncbi:MAG: Ig-like domain-containing protein [Mycobacteriales bacterium]